MSDIKLEPCPFCGGAAETDSNRAYRSLTDGRLGRAVAVYCVNCNADMMFCREDASGVDPSDLLADLIAAWNRRAAAPAKTEGRDKRQAKVAQWCEAAFGAEQTYSVAQRGLRLLEEAIEAYQAAGCDIATAHKLVDYVFARPPGDLQQELGGVGMTVLALANACGASAEAEEVREFNRVLSKPLAHFAARNQAKNDAGFQAAKVVEVCEAMLTACSKEGS